MTFFYTFVSLFVLVSFLHIYSSFVICRESNLGVSSYGYFVFAAAGEYYDTCNIKRHIIIYINAATARSPPLFFALHSEVVSVILISSLSVYTYES